MKIHELKTDKIPFAAIWNESTKFDMRPDDRDFKINDILILKETKYTEAAIKKGKPLLYTGRSIFAKITYIMRGPVYGLMDGWVLMSFEEIGKDEK